MTLTIIAAVGLDGSVGQDGKLPWSPIPGDLYAFRELTAGSVLLMGRKTLESLPAKFNKGDRQIWLMSSQDPGPNSLANNWFRSWEEFHEYGHKNREVFVCGGTSIWAHLVPKADRMFITHVLQTFPKADTWFPAINWAHWRETPLIGRDTYFSTSVLVGTRLAVRRRYVRRTGKV